MNQLQMLFENMLKEHITHLDRLTRWKQLGGKLEKYPEHESIDDFIAREKQAIENLRSAIEHLLVLAP